MADPLPDNLPTPAALASAMMEMKDLGDEPEFADLESTLGDDLISVVVEMMAKVEDDLQRLEDKGDEAGIDRLIAGAKSSTLNKLVTPTLVAEVQKRLTRLTRRLRQEGQSQRADLFNGLTQLMDTSFFPWPLFGPLSDALEKTVERIATYTILRTQVAEAVGMSPQDVPFEQIHELLQDPTVLERLQEQFETDQDMRKMLEKQFDQLYTKLTHTLSQGDLHLDLFTMEELALWDALSDQRSTESDIDLEYDEQDSKSTEILAETLKETMYLLNTPPRQDRWREHLAQLDREATEGEMQTVLSLLLNILADPTPSQELETWLFHALVGEHRQLQDRLDVDEALDDQYKGICEQIQTRLSRGEPPLP